MATNTSKIFVKVSSNVIANAEFAQSSHAGAPTYAKMEIRRCAGNNFPDEKRDDNKKK